MGAADGGLVDAPCVVGGAVLQCDTLGKLDKPREGPVELVGVGVKGERRGEACLVDFDALLDEGRRLGQVQADGLVPARALGARVRRVVEDSRVVHRAQDVRVEVGDAVP